MEENITKKTYLSMDGEDNINKIRKVLESISSGGAGSPVQIQCLVDADGYGMFRIKDIRFNNRDRSVRIHIDAEHPVEGADYRPDTNTDRLLYPRRQDFKKKQEKDE